MKAVRARAGETAQSEIAQKKCLLPKPEDLGSL